MEITAMDKILEEMAEHFCDNLCMYGSGKEPLTQEELDEKCANCKMGQFICDISNTYNSLNEFGTSQIYKLMEKYKGFVKCEECVYKRTDEKNGAWCHCSDGLPCYLQAGDGCSKGKRKGDAEKTILEEVYAMVSESDTKEVSNGEKR